jgi:plastocyanin
VIARIAASAVAAAALAAAAPARAAPVKDVAIYDNYYLPAKLTVARGATVRWRWPDEPIDVHDVRLRKGPAGVKRFWSEPASSGYVFRRTLRRPGLYQIVCTLHEEMTMTIRVRR